VKALQVINTAATLLLLGIVLIFGFYFVLHMPRERGLEPPMPVGGEAPPPPVRPANTKLRLVVIRGIKMGVQYPIYEGQNYIGRADEKPVDIDLEDQEPPDRIWSSRQHALIMCENGNLVIEDLNSSNGTFVNRGRVFPGQKQLLKDGDVIQIGTVQMKIDAQRRN
jgi:FHA domain